MELMPGKEKARFCVVPRNNTILICRIMIHVR